MVLFDDVECILYKKLKAKIYNIMKLVLQTGRSFNVSVCVATHELCNAHETKQILNEAHVFILFKNIAGDFS